MKQIERILPCFDFFGTKPPSFYTDGQPRLYSCLGGIFFILSTLICIFVYVKCSLKDFRQLNPITTISSIPSEGYRKVKINEEKIWIPWRISDYNHKYINHTNLIYPEIIFYYGEKNNSFKMNEKKLNYKLCNETLMINKSNIYKFNIPLDQLYCIDMDNIEIGGSWMSNFINFIQFDLYYCKNGIDYDENNNDCTNDEKIINEIGEKNSLTINIYYPVVQFQPMNKTNPIIIIYREYFYHFSRNSFKIDRLYLEEHVLNDDLSFYDYRPKNYTYWGLSSIGGDNYCNGKYKELMNEGSTSIIYSLNLYLEPGITYYKRYYKKIYTSISSWLPAIYIIFILFKNIAKIFKYTEGNKKMFELLFENLKERPDKFKLFSDEIENISKEDNKSNLKQNFVSNRGSSIKIKHRNNLKKMKSINYRNAFNISSNNKIIKKQTKIPNKIYDENKIILNSSKFVDEQNKNITTNNNGTTQDKLNLIDQPNSFLKLNKTPCQKKPSIQSLNINFNKNRKSFIPSVKSSVIQKEKEAPKVQFIKKKLFPYKYYFSSVIFSRCKIQKNCIYSNKFARVYNFLAKFLDISTYLILLRQFHFIKNNFFNRKDLYRIEEDNKINVNKSNYFRDVNEGINYKEVYLHKNQ